MCPLGFGWLVSLLGRAGLPEKRWGRREMGLAFGRVTVFVLREGVVVGVIATGKASSHASQGNDRWPI